MPTKILPVKVYASVLGALLLGLLLNVALAFPDLGRFRAVIMLTISCCQALLIMLCFMHLRHGARLLWFSAAAGFFWLAVMIILTMSDYISRN